MGPYETEESCQKWKEEYALPFPVVPDAEGVMFKQLTNGWVPYTILVGKDGRVAFWESDFDEAGFGAAIEEIYQGEDEVPPEPAPVTALQRVGPVDRATIVVLGGGAGGLVAAHHLRRQLSGAHRVVLVDRSADHLFQSSLLWHMVGHRRTDQIRRPLSDLSRKGIEFVNDEVVEIDLAGRRVRTPTDKIDFDYLVVALGARLAPETVAGFDEMALNLYDLSGTAKIHEALESFSGGRVGVLVTSMPFKCPAAPYEAALLVESLLRVKGVRDDTEVHVYTPEHAPMPMAGPAMGEAITEVLRARDIHFHPLFTFKEMQPDTRTIVPSTGDPEQVDLLLAVPPHFAPEVVRASGLTGASGWIHADRNTLLTEHEGVYAIGDVTTIRLANGKTLPMAGVFAHYQAKVVAERIVAEIQGGRSSAVFDGKGSCWLELGDGKAAFARGDFYDEPEPSVSMYWPGRFWHWGKVLFEKWWLRHWF